MSLTESAWKAGAPGAGTETGIDAAADTLVDAFAASVRHHPNRTAVRSAGRALTYSELDAQADALAADIRAATGERTGPVGILLERSADLVVAAIAALRAGTCYVPLDPAVPPARLALILDEAEPAVVVCSRALAPRLPPDTRLLHVDDPRTGTIAGTPPAVAPTACAYVIFTSGTSGRPKGVEISHRNVMSLFAATDRLFTFGCDDVWSMFHSFAFDFSVWEMWGALLHGGCVVVVESEVLRDPAALRRLLRDERVTVLSQTPTAFTQLAAEEREHQDHLPLRWVVFGGEALRPRDLEPWVAKYGDDAPALVNMYGITETTVHATHRRIRTADLSGHASPIGSPLPGSDILLVDGELAPVAPGTAGEIVVTGPQVGLGYLGHPELTRERFVELTGPGGHPVRGYRSGDLARRRPDGDLEFAGRADDQVKIRGFRVELGDVESVLAGHPAVRSAAVALGAAPSGEPELVGYLVPAGAVPDERRLREDLSRELPDYMVPSTFRVLDALPRTPNGKLDRAALADRPIEDTGARRGPESLREELMCDLFAQALGRPTVGRDDDFFLLGGHSLSAIRLVNRIRAVLGVEVSIQDLFEARTVAGLAGRAHTGSVRPPLVPCERPADIPLSYAQQRLWFLHQMHEASSAYHIPYALRLTGPLDAAALESAIGDVVARHEILRTVYPERDGTPVQRILPAERARPRLAVDHHGAERFEERLLDAVRAGFDLATDPPLRAALFVLGAEEHVLLVVLHHIAADGWSLEPLFRDLADAYTARLRGAAPAWEQLAVQYADYALWQRALLGDPADPDSIAGRQLAFWTEYLRGAPDELDIPTDRARPRTTRFAGGVVDLDIDADLHARLAELARASATTVGMVLQAAVAALLTRLGAGTDLPIGVAIAGRTDDAVHPLVGIFVNTVVSRTDTSGDPSFVELLRRVRTTNLAAFDHQDLPFERLVEMLNPERAATRHPLTQVMVGAQPAVLADVTLPGLAVHPRPITSQSAKFDLSLSFEERRGVNGAEQGITTTIGYSRDLFDHRTVERFAARLTRVLTAAAERPGTPLSGIDVLGAEERRLLAAWNDTDAPRPEAPTVAALVERQVDRSPDAVAVVQGGCRWTYRQVEERANRIANLLRDLGVGPETMVGLCVARGPWFVAAVLGVWKAGGAYLPLESRHPAEHKAHLLRRSGARVLLTDADQGADLPVPDGVEVVRLDGDDRVAAAATTRPARWNSGGNLAYAVYTSGSTGNPKCVLLEHRGVVTRLRDVVERFALTPEDINLQVISLGFEVPVREIFAPLSIGAAVALLPPDGERDPGIVVQTIRQARPTIILCAVHSLIESLLAYDVDAADFASVRLVGTGGEVLRPAEADQMMHAWGCEVVNQYGPTETTMMACVHTVRAADLAGRIPVGRPLSNTRVHLLDASLAPVPIGVTGEVYLAGAGLGRGYLGQPGLTAGRFVADPFGAPGERMYRSGDLARWRTDGELEFVGRIDDQVKVRGFRIELGEIEAVLAEHPRVSRAAVTVREDRPGDRRLAAYLVPAEPSDPPSVADLRDQLSLRLPEHMVPGTFTLMDTFPLRLNGKLNRDLLPVPDVTGELASRPPRTPYEEILCQLFAEVLGLPAVGIDDDFFQLGGHSLLAARLISRVRATLGVEMAMRSLFEAPTVAGLALRLGTDSSADALEVMLPLRPNGTREPVFCIHPGGGLSWSYVGLLKHIPPSFPLYGVQARGLLHPDEMPESIEDMAASYLTRIRAVHPQGPYHLLGWSLGGMVAYEMAVQLQAQGARVGLLALLDCYPGMPDHFRIDDRTMLRSLLDPSRPDAIPEEGSAELAKAVEIVRQDTGALANLSEQQVIALLRTMSHNRRIVRDYTPTFFDGDLLFFLATENRVPDAPGADVWHEHVSGEVICHPVRAAHITIGHPEPLAHIGRVVADTLTETGGARC